MQCEVRRNESKAKKKAGEESRGRRQMNAGPLTDELIACPTLWRLRLRTLPGLAGDLGGSFRTSVTSAGWG